MLSCFSHVWLFVTLWPIPCQATLSLAFSRQKYWSGFLHALLQGIFLTPRLNWCFLRFLHWQVNFLPLVPPGKPIKYLLLSTFSVQKQISGQLSIENAVVAHSTFSSVDMIEKKKICHIKLRKNNRNYKYCLTDLNYKPSLYILFNIFVCYFNSCNKYRWH